MSQQVGITLGTPVMSALVTAFAAATLLPGIQVAIAVNAAVCLLAAIVIAVFLRLPVNLTPAGAPCVGVPADRSGRG